MNNLKSVLGVSILAVSLSGCGKKTTVGPQAPPPGPPVNQKTSRVPVPGGTSPTGSIMGGPVLTPSPQPGPGPGGPGSGPSGGIGGGPTIIGGGANPAPQAPPPTAPRPTSPPRPVPAPPTSGNAPTPPVTPAPPVSIAVNPAEPWTPDEIAGSLAEGWLSHEVDPVLSLLKNQPPPPRELSQRQRLTLALGYFDGFHESPLDYEGKNEGLHASVDPFLRSLVHEVLTRDCEGRLQICEFNFTGGDETQSTYSKAGLGGVVLEIRVVSSSLSPRYKLNVGEQKARQTRRSQTAERIFHESLKDSDYVLYVGHSRLGGGPDFYAPQLKANGEVNYPAYQKEQKGLKRLKQALQGAVKAQALGIFSCDSNKLFAKELALANPRLQLATMNGVILSEKLVLAALASMDLWLRQGTLANAKKFVSVRPDLQSAFQLKIPSGADK